MNLRTILSFFAAGCIAISFQTLASDEGYWISDAGGCKVVLSPKPEPRVTVTWSGACPDGFAQGKGTLEWLVDGKPDTKFDISTVNGKPEGEGSFVTTSGLQFQGSFVEGKLSGKGVMTWPNGDHYEGDWSGGHRSGRGVLTRANGDHYEGDFVDDRWSGKGVAAFYDGNRYEGDWIDNKRDGKGVQIFADGVRYEGEWKADKRAGEGEQVWPDGSHYKGMFADNKPVNPELIVRKTYAVREFETGSHIRGDSINTSVPLYKSYAALTAEEKKLVKSRFGLTAEADEPPYPRHGPAHIYQELKSIEQKLQVNGVLSLAVTIDAAGNPIAVDVSQSPDARMTQAMTDVLMLEKYKPAMCGATACQKQYFLVVNVRTEP
jgi:hypothetical protein